MYYEKFHVKLLYQSSQTKYINNENSATIRPLIIHKQFSATYTEISYRNSYFTFLLGYNFDSPVLLQTISLNMLCRLEYKYYIELL